MASLTVGTNSWVTLTEADTYLENKFDTEDWFALGDQEKTNYLITAFRFIRQKYDIEASSTEQDVKDAQIETAWWMYEYWNEWYKRSNLYAAGVREFDLSKFSEVLEKATVPQFLEDLLSLYSKYGTRFPEFDRELE